MLVRPTTVFLFYIYMNFIFFGQPLVNAAFAPDGSAIALAYYSGIVKFFLVGLELSKTE